MPNRKQITDISIKLIYRTATNHSLNRTENVFCPLFVLRFRGTSIKAPIYDSCTMIFPLGSLGCINAGETRERIYGGGSQNKTVHARLLSAYIIFQAIIPPLIIS